MPLMSPASHAIAAALGRGAGLAFFRMAARSISVLNNALVFLAVLVLSSGMLALATSPWMPESTPTPNPEFWMSRHHEAVQAELDRSAVQGWTPASDKRSPPPRI